MATKKITQLTELSANPELTDILPIVDDPAVSAETKKITVQNLLTTTSPTITASGDIKAGSGLSVGNTSDTPGDGEIWLVEKSSSPSATTDRAKLINNANELILVDDAGTAERLSGEGGVTLFLDGGDATLTTGDKLYSEAPYDCDVLSWVCVADASGSISATVQKTTYANFPSTGWSTVATVTLSSAQKNSGTLSSQTFTKGDIIKVNVSSATTVKKVAITLKVRKT